MKDILNTKAGLFIGNILSFVINNIYVFVLFSVLIIAGFAVVIVLINKKHKESDYYKQTGKDLFYLDKDKGSSAEFIIGKQLERINGYKKLIYNCYIPKADGGTTEIDVIMIHEKGLFVIESKNYSGWIFGNEDHKQWTQVLKGGRRGPQKYSFYNPIKQNVTHIKWLNSYLKTSDIDVPYYSFIVFGNDCVLKDVTTTSDRHFVLYRCQLIDAIQMKMSVLDNKLTEPQIDAIYEKLFPLTQVGEAEKLMHIYDVAMKKEGVFHSQKNTNEEDLNACSACSDDCEDEFAPLDDVDAHKESTFIKKCPKCGADLVLRTVKNGDKKGQKFWGCSSFPKCRYIENIN